MMKADTVSEMMETITHMAGHQILHSAVMKASNLIRIL
jgi:hypothetical protein